MLYECVCLLQQGMTGGSKQASGQPGHIYTDTHTHSHPPLFVCVCACVCVCVCARARALHLVPCLGSYIIISNSKAGSTLYLFLAGTALGGWPAYRGSILVAREGWAGTRQANCNWGCLSEPQPKSALCAGPKLFREGEFEQIWWHTDVARSPKKRGKALPASLNWPWVFSLWGSSVPLLVISNAEGTACRWDSEGGNEASAVAVI